VQRGRVSALPQPVDRAQHWFALNEISLECILLGKVHEDKPDQNGEQTLTGNYQHHDAEYHHQQTQQIFQNQKQQSHRKWNLMRDYRVAMGFGEVIRRQAHDEPGHYSQGAEKTDKRKYPE